MLDVWEVQQEMKSLAGISREEAQLDGGKVFAYLQNVGEKLNCFEYGRASLRAQVVKYLPAMQGTRAQSLGREDPLEKAMAPQSSILVWRIPWTEELGGLQSMGSQIVRDD